MMLRRSEFWLGFGVLFAGLFLISMMFGELAWAICAFIMLMTAVGIGVGIHIG